LKKKGKAKHPNWKIIVNVLTESIQLSTFVSYIIEYWGSRLSEQQWQAQNICSYLPDPPCTNLGLDENGEPSLAFSDDQSVGRCVLGSTSLEHKKTGMVKKRSVSSLVLFDKDRKVIWNVP
jgi:hypothetical protein